MRIQPHRLLVLLAVSLCVVAANGGADAKPISLVATEVNVDWTAAGVGGISRTGEGLIQLHGVRGTVKKALLYWHGISSRTLDPDAPGLYTDKDIFFGGHLVPGVDLGLATTNCWGSGSSTAYRADVTDFVLGDGVYQISGLAEVAGDGPNGAALVVIFDDGDPRNNRTISIFEGNDSSRPEGLSGEDLGWHASLFPVVYNGGAVRATFIVADGQSFRDDSVLFGTQTGSFTLVDTPGLFDGTSTPSMGASRTGSGDLWDVHTVEITQAFPAGVATGQLTLDVDGMADSSDCLGLVAMIIETEAGVPVHGIQITQAVQVEQTLADFKAQLDATGEPPIPIIAGKPSTARISFETPAFVNKRVVQFEVSGLPASQQTLTLQPGCSPQNQEVQALGCNTANFTFPAPHGQWNLKVTVSDDLGNKFEEREFSIRSREGKAIELQAVRVCDTESSGIWICESNPANTIATNATKAATLFPATAVNTVDSVETVRRDRGAYDFDGDGTVSDSEGEPWWVDVVTDLASLYATRDGSRDLFADPVRRYVGVSRAGAPASGMQGYGDGRPGHAFALRNPALWNDGSIITPSVFAHELGHLLGRNHTAVASPSEDPATGRGCILSTASSTDWPFSDNLLNLSIDNQIKQVAGYDPTQPNGGMALNPYQTYDIMGYCVPQWVSGFTYLALMDELARPAFRAPVPASLPGPSWRVGGALVNGVVSFRPLLALDVPSSASEGSGSHAVEARDAEGNVLSRRRFEPEAGDAFSTAPTLPSDPFFVQLLPVDARAARIVVLGAAAQVIGQIDIGGAAPGVTVLFPAGGETLSGRQTIRWAIDDSDSTAHSAWVQYSPDGSPGSFATLAVDLRASSLDVDFDELPGSLGRGVVRVVASDGAQSGSADSEPFTVPPKVPRPKIIAPVSGAVRAAFDTVLLQGTAFDPDDGVLGDAALAWRSSQGGALGNGRQLAVRLAPGLHTITLEARDRDGNVTPVTMTVVVAGIPPKVGLALQGADVPHPSCVRATFGVTAGDVPVVRAEYSADGGVRWTPVDPGSLPVEFNVPGQGVVHLIVRAIDAAEQLDAADRFVFIETACPLGGQPPRADAGADATLECTGPAGAALPLDASASSDPDGDSLRCRWSAAACSIADAAACLTTATCPTGDDTVTLIVNDGQFDSAPATKKVAVRDSTPPTGGITFPLNGACVRGPVTVADDIRDGCDAHPQRTYSPAPGPVYPAEGALSVVLDAQDAAGNHASSAVSFVIDDTPPAVRLQPIDTTQRQTHREPLSRYLQTGDADAAPGDVVRERILVDGCVALDGLTYGNGDGRLVDESVDLFLPLFCRVYRQCGRADFTDAVLRAEADDCAGNTGAAQVVLPGHFHIDATTCGP